MTLISHSQLMTQGYIGFGRVWHRRTRPKIHVFTYKSFFLLLPMRAWQQDPTALPIPRSKRGMISFSDHDHGDGRSADAGGCLAWLDEQLRAANVLDADGEIWLQTYPRLWGYCFKPVSFWYCYSRQGDLCAVVAEVNNTFGARHAYVLPTHQLQAPLQAAKIMQVSPFCRPIGHYQFHFALSANKRTVARIAYYDSLADGAPMPPPLIETAISGTLQAMDDKTLRRAVLAHPLHSFAVIARIHWQALRLLRKRIPFYGKSPVEPISPKR